MLLSLGALRECVLGQPIYQGNGLEHNQHAHVSPLLICVSVSVSWTIMHVCVYQSSISIFSVGSFGFCHEFCYPYHLLLIADYAYNFKLN